MNSERRMVPGRPAPSDVLAEGRPLAAGELLRKRLLDDFRARVREADVRVLVTLFLEQEFYLANGFVIDEGWGGLVQFLD